jgi:anti-sigma factor (TIGR02949 family)
VNRVTCEEAFRRLDDYLDRELADEELRLVEAHLADCASCLQEFTYERSMLDRLKDKLRRLPTPPDLLARIQRALGDTAGGGPDPK